MFDDLVSNKYFIIALIIALLVVLYLYSQKESCSVEGMQNIDFTPLSHELIEKPWTDKNNGLKYKSVNNAFDTHADKKTKQKIGGSNFLKRKDETYEKYMEQQDNDPVNINQKPKKIAKNPNVPQPLNDRPDLSQCQPCICPNDIPSTSDSDDSESHHSRKIKLHRKN